MNLLRASLSLFSTRPHQLLLSRCYFSRTTKHNNVILPTVIFAQRNRRQETVTFLCSPPLLFILHQLLSSSHGGDRSLKKKKSGGKGVSDRPKVILDDDEMERVLALEALQEAAEMLLAKLKTDLREQYNVRLNPRQIESLKVTSMKGGIPVALADIATVTWTRSELIVNLTTMPSAVKPVLHALHHSGLNLNPQTSAGSSSQPMIYIPLPKAVTTEHRQALVKAVQAAGQATKNQLKDRHFQKRFYHLKENLKGVSADLLADVAANLTYYIKEKCREVDVIVQQKVDSLDK